MIYIDLAVPAAAQPARDGVSPLSANPVAIGGVCLPAARHDAAASMKRPRPGAVSAAGFWPPTLATVTKPGHTNIRNQNTNMTRVYADGEGGLGPHPLSKPA